MIKKAIFIVILLVLIINFIEAIDIRIIQPQQGDVNEEDIYPSKTQFCDVNWECSEWGKCINNHKKRICVDTNNCQYKYNSPITEIACTKYPAKESASSTVKWLVFSFFTFILLLILLIILLGLRR